MLPFLLLCSLATAEPDFAERLELLEEAVEQRDVEIDDLRSASAELLALIDADVEELVEVVVEPVEELVVEPVEVLVVPDTGSHPVSVAEG